MKGRGAADDDIVNALTGVYCAVALSSTAPPTERAAALGTFSGLVYGQIKRGANRN
jgi:hypothetical protein